MRQAGWNSDYIAVDWGTTNRRAYRVTGNDSVVDSFSDGNGVLAIAPGGFDFEVAEIRSRLGDLPMLLAGMVGSNKGWHAAPYVNCPAGAEQIAENILWVDDRTGIVPGVSYLDPPDVMRGEEVQILGAITTGLAPPDGLMCLPGTHTKWCSVADRRLKTFRTAMTGEIFSLLRQHSILAEFLQNEVSDDDDFCKGVADALEFKPLITALFSVRARHLLGEASGNDASYISGLLIGTDWRDGAVTAQYGVISVVGTPELCTLYAKAASLAGNKTRVIDGNDVFVAGMATLLASI